MKIEEKLQNEISVRNDLDHPDAEHFVDRRKQLDIEIAALKNELKTLRMASANQTTLATQAPSSASQAPTENNVMKIEEKLQNAISYRNDLDHPDAEHFVDRLVDRRKQLDIEIAALNNELETLRMASANQTTLAELNRSITRNGGRKTIRKHYKKRGTKAIRSRRTTRRYKKKRGKKSRRNKRYN